MQQRYHRDAGAKLVRGYTSMLAQWRPAWQLAAYRSTWRAYRVDILPLTAGSEYSRTRANFTESCSMLTANQSAFSATIWRSKCQRAIVQSVCCQLIVKSPVMQESSQLVKTISRYRPYRLSSIVLYWKSAPIHCSQSNKSKAAGAHSRSTRKQRFIYRMVHNWLLVNLENEYQTCQNWIRI